MDNIYAGDAVKTYSDKDGQLHNAIVINCNNTCVQCFLDNNEIVYRCPENLIKEKIITKDAFLKELQTRINDLLMEYKDWTIKED